MDAMDHANSFQNVAILKVSGAYLIESKPEMRYIYIVPRNDANGGIAMKLYNIRNSERFLDVLSACEGPVYAISPRGERVNMKNFAQQARGLGLTLNATGDEGIELIAERGADCLRLFRFMAEAAKGAA